MSLDLTLIPKLPLTASAGYTRFFFRGWNEFTVEALRKEALLYVDPIDDYDDEGLEARTTDKYGDPLTYVTAGRFYQILYETRAVPTCAEDTAVVAYLNALPPTTAIVLYWT